MKSFTFLPLVDFSISDKKYTTTAGYEGKCSSVSSLKFVVFITVLFLLLLFRLETLSVLLSLRMAFSHMPGNVCGCKQCSRATEQDTQFSQIMGGWKLNSEKLNRFFSRSNFTVLSMTTSLEFIEKVTYYCQFSRLLS